MGDRRRCPNSKCKRFLSADHHDHYCSRCRYDQKKARERLLLERDKRFLGHMAMDLLRTYYG